MAKANKNPDDKRQIGDYSALAFIFPVSIAVGVGIGYLLDLWFHTSPYLLLVFTIYGIASGFVSLFKLTKVKKNDKKNP
ncbi:MAG: AtpZ/AtpI family protein [Candidatus Omnitrophota bacterium]